MFSTMFEYFSKEVKTTENLHEKSFSYFLFSAEACEK